MQQPQLVHTAEKSLVTAREEPDIFRVSPLSKSNIPMHDLIKRMKIVAPAESNEGSHRLINEISTNTSKVRVVSLEADNLPSVESPTLSWLIDEVLNGRTLPQRLNQVAGDLGIRFRDDVSGSVVWGDALLQKDPTIQMIRMFNPDFKDQEIEGLFLSTENAYDEGILVGALLRCLELAQDIRTIKPSQIDLSLLAVEDQTGERMWDFLLLDPLLVAPSLFDLVNSERNYTDEFRRELAQRHLTSLTFWANLTKYALAMVATNGTFAPPASPDSLPRTSGAPARPDPTYYSLFRGFCWRVVRERISYMRATAYKDPTFLRIGNLRFDPNLPEVTLRSVIETRISSLKGDEVAPGFNTPTKERFTRLLRFIDQWDKVAERLTWEDAVQYRYQTTQDNIGGIPRGYRTSRASEAVRARYEPTRERALILSPQAAVQQTSEVVQLVVSSENMTEQIAALVRSFEGGENLETINQIIGTLQSGNLSSFERYPQALEAQANRILSRVEPLMRLLHLGITLPEKPIFLHYFRENQDHLHAIADRLYRLKIALAPDKVRQDEVLTADSDLMREIDQLRPFVNSLEKWFSMLEDIIRKSSAA